MKIINNTVIGPILYIGNSNNKDKRLFINTENETNAEVNRKM